MPRPESRPRIVSGGVSDLTDDLKALLAGFQRDGLIVGGAQLAAFQEGRLVADVAYGVDHLGEPMATGSYSCTYCISKVPLFLALLGAIDAGRISPETRIGEILADANPWVAEATILDTLSQRAGFSSLQGPVSRFVPFHLRRVSQQWLLEAPNMPRGTQCYSVSEVGWLVAAMLERLHDRHYADVIGSVVTGMFGPEVLPAPTGGLAVTYQPSQSGDPVPLLNEATRTVQSQWNPSLGWYTSAMGVARLGAALGDAWHGRTTVSRDLIRFATAPVAEPVHDRGLGREASFGLGFWTDLFTSMAGVSLSGSAFGHNAQGGTSFLVVDPERELSIAACFDLSVHEDAQVGVRRGPVVETIVRAVDG